MSAALALSAQNSAGCRLVSVDGRALPLREVHVDAEAAGGLARVTLRQRFANPYEEPLRATYQLPLPDDGAVVDFSFVIAGRRIRGRVERKASARAAFEQAVSEGRTAALLEQDRSSLFTQELGNLPPGAEIDVEIEVEQLLRWEQGGWEWRWPTTVGPRYLGAPGETPDAQKIEVAVADRGLGITARATLRTSDTKLGAFQSPSHTIDPHANGEVSLQGGLDRDIVVRWPVAAVHAGVSIEVSRPAGDSDAYALVTLVPPSRQSAVVPRDLCLLLDTSGSMSGAPLAQLVALSKRLVEGLRPGDRLEMIEFSSSPNRWNPQPVEIGDRSRAEALRWLDSLRASGGTAMHEAVTEALRPLRADAERQVVLMTDGYIGFEAEVIGRIVRGLPKGSRIHTVGVGSSVNRTLTRGVARAGGGYEGIVGIGEDVAAVAGELLARAGDPLWVDVTLSGSAVKEVAPRAIPDLLAGRPSRILVRLDAAGGALVVNARGPEGLVAHEERIAAVGVGTGRRVIATRFAREAVDDLEIALSGGESKTLVDSAIEAIGLRNRIATRLTSWVAATEEATVDPGDPIRSVEIPHELPHGVSAQGVGLRQPSPVSPAQTFFAAPASGESARNVAPSPARPGGLPRPSSVRKDALSEEPKKRSMEEDAANMPVESDEEERLAAPEPSPAEQEEGPSLLQRFRRMFKAKEAPETRSAQTRPPAPPREAQRKITLSARVVSLADGKLVLEIDIPSDLDWQTSGMVVFAQDGSRHPMSTLPGTTGPRRLARGQTARIVLSWPSPRPPARIEAGGLDIAVLV